MSATSIAAPRQGRIRDLVARVRTFLSEFDRTEPFRQSAALSYYALLSFAPLVLVVVALAGIFFGRPAVEERIVLEVQNLVGAAGAEVIKAVLENARGPQQGIALGIGFLTLLIGATTVFVELQGALNRIWGVEARAESGIKKAIWSRVLSFTMVATIGFLLLLSLIMSAAITAMSSSLRFDLPIPEAVWKALDAVVSFGILMLLFAAIFKVLPQEKISWRDVRFGAFVTALLFTAGKFAIGLYLGHATIGSAYGAAGSIIVLMAWTYYASLIFLFGAQITHVHARRRVGAKRSEPYVRT